MPSLIKRRNLNKIQNNIERLHYEIVILLNRINIPINYYRLINKNTIKIIRTNKLLYYKILYITLKIIYKYLHENLSKINEHKYTIDFINIYFKSNYKDSYTYFNFIKIN